MHNEERKHNVTPRRGPGFGGPRRGGVPGEKAKDFKGTTKKLIKDYLSKYKVALIIVIIFAIGSFFKFFFYIIHNITFSFVYICNS